MGVSLRRSQFGATHAARRDAEVALRWAIALALGDVASYEDIAELTNAAERIGWDRILSTSARERLLGPVWLRSGQLLRTCAPSETVAAYRQATARLDEVGRTQLSALGAALNAFRAAGVPVVVLKGAALSKRAYGTPFLRDTSDVDVFVAARHRVHAHDVLSDAGWRHVDGAAPDDATYLRQRGGERVFMEVHSSLSDDPLVRHVALPDPRASVVEIEGVRVPAHDGPTLAPYLAVHLAKHTSAPLSWIVDFDAVWMSLSELEQSAARRLALKCGAAGYLDLALRRARWLRAAAKGDKRAQRKCGGASGLYRERHAAIVGALAAPTPVVGARVLASWIARRVGALGSPAPWTPSGRLAWLDRAVASVRRTSPVASASHSGQVTERVLQLEIDTSLEIVRSVLAEGLPVWLVARGGSMAPTIRSGAQVLVAPRGAGDVVQPGDIVFAAPRDSTPVIHRVRSVADDRAILRGDALDYDDAPVDDSEIVGRVTHVRSSGRVEPLGNRPPSPLVLAVRRMLHAGMQA